MEVVVAAEYWSLKWLGWQRMDPVLLLELEYVVGVVSPLRLFVAAAAAAAARPTAAAAAASGVGPRLFGAEYWSSKWLGLYPVLVFWLE